jgi:hypothetical protein
MAIKAGGLAKAMGSEKKKQTTARTLALNINPSCGRCVTKTESDLIKPSKTSATK